MLLYLFKHDNTTRKFAIPFILNISKIFPKDERESLIDESMTDLFGENWVKFEVNYKWFSKQRSFWKLRREAKLRGWKMDDCGGFNIV